MKTARQLALDTLCRVESDGAYSAIAFDRAAKRSGLPPRDVSYAAALFYGVLERRITLDAMLSPYLKKGGASLDCPVRNILRMGAYELYYMDAAPDRAAVNEAVALARYAKKTSAGALINAVLRRFLREGKPLPLPDAGRDPDGYFSVRYGVPAWIIRQWTEQYGSGTAEALAKAALSRPPLYVRANTLKTTADELAASLALQGVKAEKCASLENCLMLSGTGSIDRLPAYGDGLFYVQDFSSQMCVRALAPRPGDTVLDICAAPGSKSFTAAQMMENRGRIFAFDLYPHKCRLIEKGAARLGITIIKAKVRDGAQDEAPLAPADRILCDVPCSGLGILRRKPEIRFKDEAALAGLPELQYRILTNAARFLKPGGVLVYSTCTTNREENEKVVERFLQENSWAAPLQFPAGFDTIGTIGNFMATLLPHQTGGDGFFFASLTRKG